MYCDDLLKAVKAVTRKIRYYDTEDYERMTAQKPKKKNQLWFWEIQLRQKCSKSESESVDRPTLRRHGLQIKQAAGNSQEVHKDLSQF